MQIWWKGTEKMEQIDYKFIDQVLADHACDASQIIAIMQDCLLYTSGNQESALENEIVFIGRERDPFQQPFKHIVLHDELRRDRLFCRFVRDKGF